MSNIFLSIVYLNSTLILEFFFVSQIETFYVIFFPFLSDKIKESKHSININLFVLIDRMNWLMSCHTTMTMHSKIEFKRL